MVLEEAADAVAEAAGVAAGAVPGAGSAARMPLMASNALLPVVEAAAGVGVTAAVAANAANESRFGALITLN